MKHSARIPKQNEGGISVIEGEARRKQIMQTLANTEKPVSASKFAKTLESAVRLLSVILLYYERQVKVSWQQQEVISLKQKKPILDISVKSRSSMEKIKQKKS